jgi:hypothetical protein
LTKKIPKNTIFATLFCCLPFYFSKKLILSFCKKIEDGSSQDHCPQEGYVQAIGSSRKFEMAA